MDDYYEIYNDSWKEAERDPEFHRKFAKYNIKHNKLRLFQLYFKPRNVMDDEIKAEKKGEGLNEIEIISYSNSVDEGYIPIASQYFIVHNKIGYCLKMSFKIEFSKYGVGNTLFWVTCKYMMEHDDIKLIDFQKGNEAYKLRWGKYNEDRFRCVIINPKSVRARLVFYIAYILIPMVKELREHTKIRW